LEKRIEALESCIVFLLLSKFDNEQSDMLHRLKKQLSTDFKSILLNSSTLHPVFPSVLTLLTTKEIIPSPFPNQRELIENHPSLSKISILASEETRDFFIALLRTRVIQHNLRTVAFYYNRIRFSRLCELLNLSYDELESQLSDISSSGDLHLKIDRPAGIISFLEKKSPEEVRTVYKFFFPM
jgi:26S proteasome regulatory subunit N5